MKNIYWLEGPWPGRLAIVARPRGDEWLEDEMNRWRQSQIDIVVSLLTQAENRELGLEKEAAKSMEQGLQFLVFPIVDRAVPSSLWETRMFVENLTTLLAQGKNVAIHCRQGVGRSALLAASLLVNSGIDVSDAFRQIEIVRGCPVPDTLEQKQWVEKFAAVAKVPTW